MARDPVDLLRDGFPDRPAYDTAVSRALLERVGAGELPATLRVWRPGAMVSFGRLDAATPSFPDAVLAARARGYEAVLRVGGGRAAVFHAGTLAFGLARADADPRVGTYERYRASAELVAVALRDAGVDASVGEIAGEYCPGAHSVSAGGRLKLAGIAQRVTLRASYTEGVIVVADGAAVRDVLMPVYAALGLAWDPATAGAVEDVLPGADLDLVERALLDRYGAAHDLRPARIDDGTLAVAAALEERNRIAPDGTPPRRRPGVETAARVRDG